MISLTYVSEVLSLHKSQYDLFAVGFFGVYVALSLFTCSEESFLCNSPCTERSKTSNSLVSCAFDACCFSCFWGSTAKYCWRSYSWNLVAACGFALTLPSLQNIFSPAKFQRMHEFHMRRAVFWVLFFCIRQKESFLFHPYRRKFASRLAGKIFGMLHRKSKELMEVRRVHFEILQDILQKALNQPLKLSSWSSSY